MRLHPPSPQDTNRTTRAVIAGFAKFFPIPPNSIFTTTIATKQPTIAIQNGNVDGRLKASNIPVTTALQSEMVLGCLVITLYKYSKMIQEATQTQINMSARKPNSKVAMAVGISATTTVSIMLEVVTGSFRCGEVTTKSLFFNVIHLLLFFSQHLLAHSVVKHQITVSRAYIGAASAFDAQIYLQRF